MATLGAERVLFAREDLDAAVAAVDDLLRHVQQPLHLHCLRRQFSSILNTIKFETMPDLNERRLI